MGIREWLFGVKPNSGKPKTQFSLQTVEVDGDFEFLAKGTSFRQDAIHLLGMGTQRFLLTPELGNKYDELAVMVQGVKNGETVHVGYLPRGSGSQILVHELGIKMIESGVILSVPGSVEEGETGLVVLLSMPAQERLTELIAEYS